jgi:hypothetical protein
MSAPHTNVTSPESADNVPPEATPFDWRAHLDVHPAAELFPQMSEAELDELAADIKANGMRVPAVAWSPADGSMPPALLDGRNRLDALAALGLLYRTAEDGHVGLKTWTAGKKWAEHSGSRIEFQHVHGGDPYALALSLNIHRRHLTPEQKRELLIKVIAAQPEKSDRQIAGVVKANHKTVAAARKAGEDVGRIPHVEKREDSKGRRQPARKRPTPKKAAAPTEDLGWVSLGLDTLAESATAAEYASATYDLAKLREAMAEIEAQAAAGNTTRLKEALRRLQREAGLALEADCVIAIPPVLQ